ncbi:MAG: Hpt domain-containing protein, partial [bacterium]|nr:Hpt domain-containing protein [bacterium]
MSDTFTEYRLSFFDETDEHLSLMDDSLIAFEKNPSDTLPVDRIFRVLHTLKSSAAAVGYDGLSDLAHRAEDLIDGLRSGKPAVRASALETLFNAVDSIRAYVEAAKRGGESAVSFDAVRAEIDRFRGGRRERKSVKGRGKSPSGTPDPAAATEYERALLRETLRKGKACYEIRIEIDSAEPTKWLRAELVLNHVRATGRILRVSPPRDAFMKDGFDGRFLLWVAAELPPAEIRNRVSVDLLKRLDVVPLRKSAAEAAPAVPDKPLSEPFEKREGASTGSASSAPSSVNTVRVPVHKLDGLLHLIGELVIANSGMKLLENRLREKYHDDLIKGDMSLLNDQLMKISLGLQTDVLNMRMLPIGTVFGAFHRIVRDLSKQEGKDVNLAVSGMDTELDKKIIDAIGEPLMHLVRNAVDPVSYTHLRAHETALCISFAVFCVK